MTGYVMGGGGEGVDVSSVTATPADVLSPKVFVDADGDTKIGTMTAYEGDNPLVPNNVAKTIAVGTAITENLVVNAVPTQIKSVSPSKETQNITPDAGKYLSKVVVSPVQTFYDRRVVPTNNTTIEFYPGFAPKFVVFYLVDNTSYSRAGSYYVLAGGSKAWGSIGVDEKNLRSLLSDGNGLSYDTSNVWVAYYANTGRCLIETEEHFDSSLEHCVMAFG